MKNEDIIKMFDDLCKIVLKAIEVEQNTYSFRIPKIGASNGEIIKAMFPNVYIEETDYDIFTTLDGDTRFTYDWWNAPYEGEIKE